MKECPIDDDIADLKLKGFNVHEHPPGGYPPLSFERRDFYKVVLATGDVTIWYGDQTIDINDTFLFFSNPRVPYSVVQRAIEKNSYGCVFTESFIVSRELVEILQNLSLFNYDGIPVVPINKEQSDFIVGIFQRMLTIHLGDYEYKDAILRSCLEVIIHEGVRIQSQTGGKKKNAATRITHSFVALLERQFPIENTQFPLKLRTAQDFAQNLNVHINYLNRAVKEVAGKSTSVLISERIVAEAKALLQHTDWNIADIAYSLGFEYPSYFNNYFKKIAGVNPKSFRTKKV